MSIALWVGTIFTIFIFACGVPLWHCEARAAAMRFESDYGPLQGCMIKVGERWIPIESYRVIPE